MKTLRYFLACPFYLVTLIFLVLAITIDGTYNEQSE